MVQPGQKMEERHILKEIANTITDAPLHTMVIPIRSAPKRLIWQRVFDFIVRKSKETHRILTFYPSVVANQYRIAGEAALLPESIYAEHGMNISFIPEHQKRIVYMVAASIQNNHLEPDPELIKFIERNMTGDQLLEALVASYQTLNMEAFTNTIVLMNGRVAILKPTETSPKEGSELIASHTEA